MTKTVAQALEAAALLILLGLSTYVFSREFDAAAPLMASQPAAVFMVDNVTPDGLKSLGAAAATDPGVVKVRVFIMPGHEPGYGGAEYRTLRERDIVVSIATELRRFLEDDGAYEVVMGRDASGWNPTLKSYLDSNVGAIELWRADQARIMKQLVGEGAIEVVEEGVPHAAAPKEVANRLYGINKWIGENDFDLAVHVHVNDYGSRRHNRPGEFSGYAIYVPESQYSNSAAARMVAESVSARLDDFLAQSNAKREAGGVVEDQELVAVGRYNTADVPSILIEYGYIYEPQFQDASVRTLALREYAYQTYLGLRDFFTTVDAAEASGADAATAPYSWRGDVRQGAGYSADAFALQAALLVKGFYPPSGKTLTDCPLSGTFGPCTANALAAFQAERGIEGEKGFAGERTRETLSE